MNKYEEALSELEKMKQNHIQLTKEKYSHEPLKSNMVVRREEHYKKVEIALQELVDRATPKKVVYVKLFGDPVATCPHCQGGIFEHDAFNTKIMYSGQFCSHCGQALDWEVK